MLSGVLGAIAQVEFRRVLSFQVISTIGYMLMGLGLFTPLALAGSVFYIIQDIVVKTNLFLISGVVQRWRRTEDLRYLGGLYRASAGLALLFLIPALSLAGIPPLSGFFGKLSLVQAGLRAEEYIIVAVALIVSPLTLLSMTRVWAEAFWKADPMKQNELNVVPDLGQSPARTGPWLPSAEKWGMLVPIATLAVITVVLGLAAGPVFVLTHQAAEQLLDPSGYIEAVLGGTR
jgi:multicomponent Na+:H+ antiporter subunit D